MTENMDCDNINEDSEPKIFNPKKHELHEEEQLEMDETAYVMYHEMKVEYSCLSFDIIHDNFGSGTERSDKYPYSMYAVSGSQAATGHNNMLTVMKMNNLNRIKQKDGDDNSDDDEESAESEEGFLDDKTELEYTNIPHNGVVNRVRTTQINGQPVVASWSDLGQVHLWDLSKPVWAVNDSAYMAEYLSKKVTVTPAYSVRSHSTEGYGLDWSPCTEGMLASGDNEGNINVTVAREFGHQTTAACQRYNQSSVEDIQWSPNQSTVFATCSVDGSISMWDTRDMKRHLEVSTAHSGDVNVISWNRACSYSLVSGGDDGLVKVWDLRMVAKQKQQQEGCTHIYDYHKDCPITSVEWCPDSQYVFACSSEDNQLTLWDISLEQAADSEETEEEYPAHMLFNHMGQKEIKELHWHPQIPGLIVSTALEGFNIFRTISV